MTHIRYVPFVLVVVLTTGCGGAKHSKADVERGQNALKAALDSWKVNEPPEKLKALPDPVEYAEEMHRTHSLLEYTLGQPNTSDSAVIRYPVTLKLQDRKGKQIDREVVFEVKLGNPVVISRDPYE